MSLSHLRRVREQGAKPAMVKVVIGRKPGWLEDDASVVHIPEAMNLAKQDWLPLYGVWVTVHWTEGSTDRALAVLDCLDRAGAKLFGAASADGVIPLTAEPTPKDKNLIEREWRLLCTK